MTFNVSSLVTALASSPGSNPDRLLQLIFQIDGLHKIESDVGIKYDRGPLQKDNIYNFKYTYI